MARGTGRVEWTVISTAVYSGVWPRRLGERKGPCSSPPKRKLLGFL